MINGVASTTSVSSLGFNFNRRTSSGSNEALLCVEKEPDKGADWQNNMVGLDSGIVVVVGTKLMKDWGSFYKGARFIGRRLTKFLSWSFRDMTLLVLFSKEDKFEEQKISYVDLNQ